MLTTIAAALIALAPIPADVPTVTEDSPAWSCVDDGNRICGPGNSNGAPAGCYDDGGVMVTAWPCYVVVNQAGDADVYTPDAR